MKDRKSWTREELLKLFERTLPSFQHIEKGKFLDEKM